MSDVIKRILEERQGSKNAAEDTVEPTSQNSSEEHKYFSVLVGEGIVEDFVEFRLKNGSRTCFPYQDLLWFNYNPAAACIDLQFGSILVTVTGKGLDGALWQGIKHKRLVWVKEADSEMEEEQEQEVFVAEILVIPSEE